MALCGVSTAYLPTYQPACLPASHQQPPRADTACLPAGQVLLAEGAVSRLLIVDLDVHQGDGTALCLR
jgi:hypothetical protein